MDHATLPLLANWQNFYVIVGSSAGALTGLQFVVLTLIAQSRATASLREIRAFGTPTVVHFCTALLISALVTAPWPSLTAFAVSLGVCGLIGVPYAIGIFWHARKATYNPDFGDWIWYATLPLIAEIILVAAALWLWWNHGWALYLVAADALLFLLLGIHNSWDTVTYIIIQNTDRPKDER